MLATLVVASRSGQIQIYMGLQVDYGAKMKAAGLRLYNSGGGPHMAIVQVLQAYNRALPIGFVAKTLRRQRSDLIVEIQELVDRGVVERVGENIALIPDS